MQINTFLIRIKTFFTKKKIIWLSVIIILFFGIWFMFGRGSSKSGIETGLVGKQDIQKTVLTTGEIVSSTDLNLSLQSSGVVKKVLAKEGDVVKTGQILVVLDQSTVAANLESAQGALSQAQANYNKILAAATGEDIAVSQAAVDTAYTNLKNVEQNLIRDISISYSNVNSTVTSNTNNLFSNPQTNTPEFRIAGVSSTNQQLVNSVNIKRTDVNSSLAAWQKDIAIVNENNIDQTFSDSLSYIVAVKSYLSDLLSLLTSYTVPVDNATVAAASTSVNASKTIVDSAYTTITNDNQAVQNAKSSLAQAKASLALKQAPPRPEDLDIAKAQVLSAEGNFRSAQVALNNTVLRAPADGTITQVDIKIGELAQATKEVIKLLNVGELHTEALVSESDIASVLVGQSIDNTFDALGPDKHFTTVVLTVNPASTVISGVVNYKVTGSLEKIPEIKPGMTANMTIKVAEKKNVLVVPSGAIVNKDGKHIVKVITDTKKKTYKEVSIQTGLDADGGLTEVISGLNEGDEVVTYIK